MEVVHTPVLLQECLDYLSPVGESFENDCLMIDSTLGEGGHSEAFLNKYPSLKIIGLDRDKNIQEKAKKRLEHFSARIEFYNGWFNDFYDNYDLKKKRPNLILFDLGISVYHYEKSGRGFSFRYDEPLDMRLDFENGESACDIVNSWPEEKLADMIYLFSDEKFSRRIARGIVEARKSSKICSSKNLAEIIWNCVPASYAHGKIHPATRTFQALRIAVNSELKRLPEAVHSAFNVLETGGKMGIITFHSLEDRIVKTRFKNNENPCTCPPDFPVCICGKASRGKVVTRKPILPSEEELEENKRSKSSKLRVFEKI